MGKRKIAKKKPVLFQIQREKLESHLQSETRYHLHLSCCKLNDTKNEVRNLQLEVEELQGQENNHHNAIEERAQALQYQFEERVQALQNHFEDREQALQNQFKHRLHAFQNHFEDRVQALENRFEERINFLTVTINRLRKNLRFTSIVFAVTVIIFAALSGMSNRESSVLNRLEKNMMRNVEEQSKLEMKMHEVEKGLKGELIDLRSQLGKKLDEANNYFEAVSLNMSNHESAVSDFKTKMDRSVDRQSKLEMKMNEVEKGLKSELIDLRSHLEKKVDEAKNYFEAVSLNMSNHESAVRDFKTKMEGRVTDVRTKLEGKLDEANKYLEEKVS